MRMRQSFAWVLIISSILFTLLLCNIDFEPIAWVDFKTKCMDSLVDSGLAILALPFSKAPPKCLKILFLNKDSWSVLDFLDFLCWFAFFNLISALSISSSNTPYAHFCFACLHLMLNMKFIFLISLIYYLQVAMSIYFIKNNWSIGTDSTD